LNGEIVKKILIKNIAKETMKIKFDIKKLKENEILIKKQLKNDLKQNK
jgi:hypothetical protein